MLTSPDKKESLKNDYDTPSLALSFSASRGKLVGPSVHPSVRGVLSDMGVAAMSFPTFSGSGCVTSPRINQAIASLTLAGPTQSNV